MRRPSDSRNHAVTGRGAAARRSRDRFPNPDRRICTSACNTPQNRRRPEPAAQQPRPRRNIRRRNNRGCCRNSRSWTRCRRRSRHPARSRRRGNDDDSRLRHNSDRLRNFSARYSASADAGHRTASHRRAAATWSKAAARCGCKTASATAAAPKAAAATGRNCGTRHRRHLKPPPPPPPLSLRRRHRP